MATKLGIYNLALGTYIGTQHLADVTEDVGPRYALDRVYDDVLLGMLKRGAWKFALRSAPLTKDVTAPTLHRQHSYTKPADFVRIGKIAQDARFSVELLDYVEEGDKLYSDIDPIFLQWVSKDAAYGLNLAKFPDAYQHAVASELAAQSALPVSKDRGDRNDLLKIASMKLDLARRTDALNEPVKGKPAGQLVRSRFATGSRLNGTMRGFSF